MKTSTRPSRSAGTEPSASYISAEMQACVGQDLDRRVSYPITSSDIRRWAVAVYYPELPPQRFWGGADVGSADLAAPEDFNPFAWLVAEPAGPPPSLRDPEEVLGIASPDAPVRLRGGMSVDYGVPMRAGDVITSVRRLGGYVERAGRRGPMLLTTIVDTWTNQCDELVKSFEFTFLRFAEVAQSTTAPAKAAALSDRDDRRQDESPADTAGAGISVPGLDVPPVGAEIPSFIRKTGPANWNRFAAVNDEFVAIHMDDEAGRKAGATGAFGMGNLQWAYLHNVLRDWLGESGRIVSASCQFRGLNLKDQTLSAHGRVAGFRAEGGQTLVDLDLWTDIEDGLTLAKGTATVALCGTPVGA
ncbi:MaoC family dehydratase N-terminal domain-containing protein [Mycobacterium sp. CVI_P3]|uniref:MaoC family dehydratase N-terminal domain-containing protein n=1 Tax=Mycobacterium pinniadriaticum TaxID=2994102 RepID=A0ABT3SFB2_9MYCO|nr:MaoC family dehydratase N-terminal domain-containing protein [Mycobacterium pinniadriaticum]MCX2931742.1 MaoC family dehydratase N-terminal domain-containing protein [Mycobacterium pinniadriaticum]MCX2938183.1 MaoC family dehydratase N-terminal domain-containing protein [Mycobacterium pinniadriaticum]